jgi:hypothetical protein
VAREDILAAGNTASIAHYCSRRRFERPDPKEKARADNNDAEPAET